MISNSEITETSAHRWHLPGLDVEVHTTARAIDGRPPTYEYEGHTAELDLRVQPAA